MSDDAVIERVRKLLAMAERRHGNEAEAAVAATKAQALLAAHNLSMATVEQGAAGRREDAHIRGGMYVYERDLWRAVAELNFCFYFHSWKWEAVRGGRERRRFLHRLVGRVVNTQTTVATASYLQQTIERLCRERLTVRVGDAATPGELNSQFFSSWAVAFREGVADRVVGKLKDQRRSAQRREAAEAEARAKMAGASTATALTLSTLAQREKDANTDFLYGEGTAATWAAERAEKARTEAEADAEHARWAAAHPEEAAAEAARQAKEDRRYWSRGGGPGSRGGRDAREERQSSGAYREGWEAGKSVGIERQAEARVARRLR